MSGSTALLIGNGQITRITGQRGSTPSVPEAKFARGDVVKVSRRKGCAAIPAELVVLVAVPPNFSPDHARADMLGEPRPLMAQVGSRKITYLLARDGDKGLYLLRETDLRPSGKPSVEIGTISQESTR